MKFNVAQLLKELVGATREYELREEADLLEDIPAVAPYVGKVRLVRINSGILASARVVTAVRMTCGRCLSPVQQHLELEFTEEFRPTLDLATGAFLPAEEGDDAFRIDECHRLDVTEAVRQYAFIAMPLSALCRENCAGLCPVCGQDRNNSHCQCNPEPADPRLAVLGQLLAEIERS